MKWIIFFWLERFCGQVGLLNVEGYYDSLLTLFDKGVEEGFIEPAARHIVLSAPTATELLTKMKVIYLQLNFIKLVI